MLVNCKKEPVVLSNFNQILSFKIENKDIKATIDQTAQKIIITVPHDYNLSLLKPTIEISPKAILSPSKISSINFETISQISVIAENGDKQTYSIEIIREKSNENFIISFTIPIDGKMHEGKIDQSKNTITIDISLHLDLTKLSPSIKISEYAKIDPNAEKEQDFENEITYTVTSQNGEQRKYTVIINKIKSEENTILSFKLPNGNGGYIEGVIDNEKNSIELTIPFHLNVSNIIPVIEISDFAQIAPTNNTALDFEKELIYIVTAENGVKKTYSIKLIREANTKNYIKSFKFPDIKDNYISAKNIDHINSVVTIEVPHGYDLSNVAPSIEISENATVLPNPKQNQNFNNEIKYLVTSEDGKVKTYTIYAVILPNTANLITSFKIPDNDTFIVAEIDNTKNIISIQVPFEFDLSAIKPEIEVSESATIQPKQDVPINLEDNLKYTVTSESGLDRVYEVSIIRGANNDNRILSYKFPIEDGFIEAEIDQDNNIISILIPYDFNLMNIKPEIEISKNATIIPSNEDFVNNNVKYLIKSESGESRLYTLKIERKKNTANFILSFSILINNKKIEATIVNGQNNIILRVPKQADLSNVIPEVLVSGGATVVPRSNSIVNLEQENLIYQVKSESNVYRVYTIIIERILSSENLINSFLLRVGNEQFKGEIDHEKGTITVKIPTGRDLSSIKPEIETSYYTSLFPETSAAQNFENDITYTVAAENGDLKEYKVIIETIDLSSLTNDFSIKCNTPANFSHWFGGDDRYLDPNKTIDFEPRNVGAGQMINLEKKTLLNNFSFYLTHPFMSSYTESNYNGNVDVKLNILYEDGIIINSKTKTIFDGFDGGWVNFDLTNLDIYLQSGLNYIVTLQLVDGENLGVNTGIQGSSTTNSFTPCYLGYYSGTSHTKKDTHLDDWHIWYKKTEVNFHFKVNGKQ